MVMLDKARFFILCFILFLGTLAVGQSQVNLGLELMPFVTLNRYVTNNEQLNITKQRSMLLGTNLFIDVAASDRYHFYLGAGYTPSRIHYIYSTGTIDGEELRKLQYISLSAALRLYTDEILTGGRLFFHAGPVVDLKIHDRIHKRNNILIRENASFGDLSIKLGAGFELDVGLSTSLLAGIFYQRGLINAAHKIHGAIGTTNILAEGQDFSIKRDIIAFMLGVKF